MNKCENISEIFSNNPAVFSICLVVVILCIVVMVMLATAQRRGNNLKSSGIVILSKYKYYKESEFKHGGETIKYYTPIFVGKVNGFEYEFALDHMLEKPEFTEEDTMEFIVNPKKPKDYIIKPTGSKMEFYLFDFLSILLTIAVIMTIAIGYSIICFF